MRVLDGPPDSWPSLPGRTALTIGVYDGVHRGHRRVIDTLGELAAAESLLVTVVTFRQHPATLLAPERVPPLLTTVEQRCRRLAAAGVDIVALLDFDDGLRRLGPEAFIEGVIVAHLAPAVVAVGEDFRFGYRQQGDVVLLSKLGARHDFAVHPIPLLGNDAPAGDPGDETSRSVMAVPLSATAVRRAIAEGDLDRAAAILGYPFQICAEVVAGDGRGRGIGFPTANLDLAPHQAVPKRGVYAVRVTIVDEPGLIDLGRTDPGTSLPGVVNVGVRPTFGGVAEVVEVHILDTDEDLYGKTLCVDFVARIRDERRFDGVEELVAQIGSDVIAARRTLEGG